MRFSRFFTIMLTALTSSAALCSAKLGEMTLHSMLGQSLYATIVVEGKNMDRLTPRVQVATPEVYQKLGIPYSAVLEDLSVSIVSLFPYTLEIRGPTLVLTPFTCLLKMTELDGKVSCYRYEMNPDPPLCLVAPESSRSL